MSQTTQDILATIISKIGSGFPPEEARSIGLWIVEDRFGLTREDVLANAAITHPEPYDLIDPIITRLNDGIPIQHILGYAWFYGRKFNVDPSVLVPRQETEELVHWLLESVDATPIRLLDVGTGSGIIPITIVLENRYVEAEGWDISHDAIQVANENARLLGASVTFRKVDVFDQVPMHSSYDIIISNPPYVLASEKDTLDKMVLNDPAEALFVPDHDPLKFFQRIAALSQNMLTANGMLFVEINENFGQQTMELFRSYGFRSIELRQDLNGKDRMIRAIR